jgi:phospholipid/cholesterol/gamma-HCH transport system ATP-binding protein
MVSDGDTVFWGLAAVLCAGNFRPIPNSGLDPKTSIVIDSLIQEITEEYNITTVVITHDMNSVIEIGDQILFIYKGNKHWEGGKREILKTDNPEIIDFVYATKFMKELKSKF